MSTTYHNFKILVRILEPAKHNLQLDVGTWCKYLF
jgi:hypothetical protein